MLACYTLMASGDESVCSVRHLWVVAFGASESAPPGEQCTELSYTAPRASAKFPSLAATATKPCPSSRSQMGRTLHPHPPPAHRGGCLPGGYAPLPQSTRADAHATPHAHMPPHSRARARSTSLASSDCPPLACQLSRKGSCRHACRRDQSRAVGRGVRGR